MKDVLPNYMGAFHILMGIGFEVYFGNFFVGVWASYVLLPFFDYILPIDHSNLSPERVKIFEKDPRFTYPLYAVWILDLSCCVWLLHGI